VSEVEKAVEEKTPGRVEAADGLDVRIAREQAPRRGRVAGRRGRPVAAGHPHRAADRARAPSWPTTSGTSASLDIDITLAAHTVAPDLIERIANVEFSGGRRRNYSFATKYCSFHRPDVYHIYDGLVAHVLNTLLKQGETFDTFTRGEHWITDYAIWHRSTSRFRAHYGLEEFSIRDIDKYLWVLAKAPGVSYAMPTMTPTRAPTPHSPKSRTSAPRWSTQPKTLATIAMTKPRQPPTTKPRNAHRYRPTRHVLTRPITAARHVDRHRRTNLGHDHQRRTGAACPT
jgi:hypothetical protein